MILNPLKDLEFELYKITLTCSEETLRSRILKDKRDENAIERAVQRLKLYQSMDTIKIDTTDISVEEAVNHILQVIGSEGKISKSIS